MHFQISHETRYAYGRPVFLEPHILRLTPRSDWNQRLEEFASTCEPEPAGVAHNVDTDGNSTLCLWFSGVHESLRMVATSSVTTTDVSPFEYLISPYAQTLPFAYPESLAMLQYYRQRQAQDGDIEKLSRLLIEQVEGNTSAFLSALNRHIEDTCETETRLEGEALEAGETWQRRKGACRDLAVLFIEVCRSVGLAARFVSGYQSSAKDQESLFMHAWPEVYVPGAGWRGYDPSNGLVVTDDHVAVAAGPTPAHARPVEGSYRGTDVRSTMEVDIRIEVN